MSILKWSIRKRKFCREKILIVQWNSFISYHCSLFPSWNCCQLYCLKLRAQKNGAELGFDCCFLPEMQSSNEIEFQLQFLSIQFDSTSIKTHVTLLFVTLQCTIWQEIWFIPYIVFDICYHIMVNPIIIHSWL